MEQYRLVILNNWQSYKKQTHSQESEQVEKVGMSTEPEARILGCVSDL